MQKNQQPSQIKIILTQILITRNTEITFRQKKSLKARITINFLLFIEIIIISCFQVAFLKGIELFNYFQYYFASKVTKESYLFTLGQRQNRKQISKSQEKNQTSQLTGRQLCSKEIIAPITKFIMQIVHFKIIKKGKSDMLSFCKNLQPYFYISQFNSSESLGKYLSKNEQKFQETY